MATDFLYYRSRGEIPQDADWLVAVDTGFEDKRELLQSLGRALDFPEYFRANWDSFSECLCDLSWLDARRLVIAHHDVPLAQDRELAATYLDVLFDAQARWREAGELELIPAFPAHYRDWIEILLQSDR